jgi:hypothetical protein
MLDIVVACRQQHDVAACIYSMNQHRTVCLQPPGQPGLVVLPDAQDDVEMIPVRADRLIGTHHAPSSWYCAQLLPWPHVAHVARRALSYCVVLL